MTSDFLKTRFGVVREVPQKIFSLWAERLKMYYAQILPGDKSASDDFFLKKAAIFLHPFYILSASPFALPEMAKAVSVLRNYYDTKSTGKILIFADRDADGVTSASILYSFLTEKLCIEKTNITTLLPLDHEKYGINDDVAQRIIDAKPQILITLDTGSSNKREIACIQGQTKCTTLVFDHHFIPEKKEEYPNVQAFVNPKQLSPLSSERDLCTAGLTLKFIQAISYSFTTEYNRTYLLEGHNETALFKNGIALSPEEKQSQPFPMNQAFLDKQWEIESNASPEFASLAKFERNHPGLFNLVDKLRVLQNRRLNKIREVSDYFLPLAAAGVVADLMPLIDDNRIILTEGLSVVNRRSAPFSPGLKELFRVMKVNFPVTEQDFAFSICPAINAAGRMGNAALALETLTQNDPLSAAKKAFELVQLNEERKRITKDSLDLLEQSVLTNSDVSPVLIAYHENFHKGISGPLAGKLAEKYKKPAIVLVKDGNLLKGSARSFQNENIFALLQSVSELFVQFGGHRQAAGFSLDPNKTSEFLERVDKQLENWQNENKNSQSPEEIFRTFYPPLKIDQTLLKSGLWSDMLLLAPYGAMNPHPLLEFSPLGETKIQLMGKDKNHAKVNFSQVLDKQIEGVWFFHNGEADRMDAGGHKRIYAEPHISYFLGKIRYQLKIKKLDVLDSKE